MSWAETLHFGFLVHSLELNFPLILRSTGEISDQAWIVELELLGQLDQALPCQVSLCYGFQSVGLAPIQDEFLTIPDPAVGKSTDPCPGISPLGLLVPCVIEPSLDPPPLQAIHKVIDVVPYPGILILIGGPVHDLLLAGCRVVDLYVVINQQIVDDCRNHTPVEPVSIIHHQDVEHLLLCKVQDYLKPRPFQGASTNLILIDFQ